MQRATLFCESGGHLTGLVQVEDTHAHGPMTKLYKRQESLEAFEQLRVRGDRLPSMSRQTVMQRALDSWNAIDHEMCAAGLVSNGIAKALDGTEDGRLSLDCQPFWEDLGMHQWRIKVMEDVRTALSQGVVTRFEDYALLLEDYPHHAAMAEGQEAFGTRVVDDDDEGDDYGDATDDGYMGDSNDDDDGGDGPPRLPATDDPYDPPPPLPPPRGSPRPGGDGEGGEPEPGDGGEGGEPEPRGPQEVAPTGISGAPRVDSGGPESGALVPEADAGVPRPREGGGALVPEAGAGGPRPQGGGGVEPWAETAQGGGGLEPRAVSAGGVEPRTETATTPDAATQKLTDQRATVVAALQAAAQEGGDRGLVDALRGAIAPDRQATEQYAATRCCASQVQGLGAAGHSGRGDEEILGRGTAM